MYESLAVPYSLSDGNLYLLYKTILLPWILGIPYKILVFGIPRSRCDCTLNRGAGTRSCRKHLVLSPHGNIDEGRKINMVHKKTMSRNPHLILQVMFGLAAGLSPPTLLPCVEKVKRSKSSLDG